MNLLITLNHYLGYNLIEPCLNLLPEEMRTITREKELLQQITEHKQQIEALQKERDIYKEIALKVK